MVNSLRGGVGHGDPGVDLWVPRPTLPTYDLSRRGVPESVIHEVV